LILGPSGIYPPRVGDAKRNYCTSVALAGQGIDVTYLGKDFLYTSEGGVTKWREVSEGEENKIAAGLKSLLRRQHYNETKQLSEAYRTKAKELLDRDDWDVIYVHFLYALPVAIDELRGRPLFLDTHNSEWGWFDKFESTTRNPVTKMICRVSKKRSDDLLAMIPKGSAMVHVSMSDLEDYRRRRPDLEHLYIANGSEIRPRERQPDYAATPKNLLFFGSLHGKMSLDALKYYAAEFQPVIGDAARLVVAGANPNPAIIALCAANGWTLRRDLTDEEVSAIYEETHYSILPFSYGAGSKLKLHDAIGRGVPVLTTEAGACGGTANLPSYVTVSNDPQEWSRVIEAGQGRGTDLQQEVREYAKAYEWDELVRPLAERLRELTGSPRSEVFSGR
jgi:hypothetical protein